MAITRIRNGVKVKVSPSEVKRTIMKANNWTAEQYKKQYDIFKNKLRAFEAYEGTPASEKQSAVELLYKQAKAKIREGASYTPSIKMQRIRSFTSVSSGKAGQKALQGRLYQERRSALYKEATYKQFKGLIEKNDKAREIYENVTDPVKREKALSDYANKLKAKMNEQDEVTATEAIPSGETFGSDDSFDFDYSEYME